MSGLTARPGAPELDTHIELLEDCLLTGRLYDYGPYPCLVPGDGLVRGELWRVVSDEALEILDAWEEYDPRSPGSSVYRRRRARLLEPQGQAWVYYWNRSTSGLRLIDGGDWRAHTLRCDATPARDQHHQVG